MALKLKKVIWIVLTPAILGALAMASIYSWEHTIQTYNALEPDQQQTTQVHWALAEQSEIHDWIHTEGTARAVRKVHLAFELDGRVVEIGKFKDSNRLREGQRINGPKGTGKGQLIARLEDKDYAEELRIAKSNRVQTARSVDVAKALLQQSLSREKLAGLRFGRLERLIATKSVTRQAFDEARSQLDVAKASVGSAKAELASAKASVQGAVNAVAQASRNFQRTRIYAPWSGTVARLNIREGDYVSPQTLDTGNEDAMAATFPVTLIDTSVFEVAVEVPIYGSTQLRPGNPAFLRRQDSLAPKLSSGDSTWQPAEVFSVAPALSPGSRTLRVKLRTNDAHLSLLDGELLKTRILRVDKTALVIPVNAVIYRDNIAQVFVVDPDLYTVRMQTVKTGIREERRLEILEGLQAGDIVVTDGRRRLVNGDRVNLLENSLES